MIQRRFKINLDVDQGTLVELYTATKNRGNHLRDITDELWNAIPLEAKQSLDPERARK